MILHLLWMYFVSLNCDIHVVFVDKFAGDVGIRNEEVEHSAAIGFSYALGQGGLDWWLIVVDS